MDTELTLTDWELRALEAGAPVSISVPQVRADVMRLTREGSGSGSATRPTTWPASSPPRRTSTSILARPATDPGPVPPLPRRLQRLADRAGGHPRGRAPLDHGAAAGADGRYSIARPREGGGVERVVLAGGAGNDGLWRWRIDPATIAAASVIPPPSPRTRRERTCSRCASVPPRRSPSTRPGPSPRTGRSSTPPTRSPSRAASASPPAPPTTTASIGWSSWTRAGLGPTHGHRRARPVVLLPRPAGAARGWGPGATPRREPPRPRGHRRGRPAHRAARHRDAHRGGGAPDAAFHEPLVGRGAGPGLRAGDPGSTARALDQIASVSLFSGPERHHRAAAGGQHVRGSHAYAAFLPAGWKVQPPAGRQHRRQRREHGVAGERAAGHARRHGRFPATSATSGR